jgi:hypothetical protein
MLLHQEARVRFLILFIEKPQMELKKEVEEDNISDNENENSDSLSLQEKVLITDRIRKLSNEGLAAVY